MATDLQPGTLRVQIQTQSGCNGRCVFCPNEGTLEAGTLEHGKMEPEVFRKIVDDLVEMRPRRVSPYLMNEPLLDKRLPELIRYVSDRLPGVTSLITSNGTRLMEDLGEALIESGLRRLKVSLQSLDPATNAKLMGAQVDSANVVENVLAFKRLLRKRRAKHLDLRVSMIVTKLNHDEIARARWFWRRHGIRLVTSALENRGGNIRAAAALNPHAMARIRGDCLRPSKDLCVLWNGDVVLCCVDWWRTTILGNVARQSVRDVWEGQAAVAIREALARNDESVLPKICVCCAQSAQPDEHRHGLGRLIRSLLQVR